MSFLKENFKMEMVANGCPKMLASQKHEPNLARTDEMLWMPKDYVDAHMLQIISSKARKVILASHSFNRILVIQRDAASLLVLVQEDVGSSLEATEARDGDPGISS
jgi:hypothetical protein